MTWQRRGLTSRCQVAFSRNGYVSISISMHACGTCSFPLKRWCLFLFLHLGNDFWIPWIKEKVMLWDFQGQVIASTWLFLGIQPFLNPRLHVVQYKQYGTTCSCSSHSPMVIPASGQYSPSDSGVSDSSAFREKMSLPLPTKLQTCEQNKYCH